MNDYERSLSSNYLNSTIINDDSLVEIDTNNSFLGILGGLLVIGLFFGGGYWLCCKGGGDQILEGAVEMQADVRRQVGVDVERADERRAENEYNRV